MKKCVQFRLLAGCFIASAAFLVNYARHLLPEDPFYWTLACLPIFLALLASWICLDIARRRPSELRTTFELTAIWGLFALFSLSKWLISYRNAKSGLIRKQEKYLEWCLKLNGRTKYGKDHKLDIIDSVSDFRKRHPVTTYENYRPYVEKCLKGETNIIFNEKYPVNYVSWTSGTSGKNKVYPFNRRLNIWNYIPGNTVTTKVIQECPWMDVPLLPIALLYPTPNIRKTEIGIDCSCMSGYVIESYPPFLVTPPKTVWSPRKSSVLNEREVYYISAIFSLQERISAIVHSLPTSTHAFYVLLETDWSRICDDIRNGRICDSIQLDTSERNQLEATLSPNPKRAAELRKEFERGMKGIVRRIWPDISCIFCFLSGSFSNYREVLAPYFDGVLVYSNMHVSTEGIMGINLWPRDDSIKYALVPSGAFFEFIPENEITDDEPTTVLAHQVQVGKTYEMIVTNVHGLYRYRVGDVVKIVRFEGDLPVYQIKHRVGQMLNAYWEKTPESAFLEAISRTMSEWGVGISLTEYTATEMVNVTGLGDREHSGKRGYVVFVELSENSGKLVAAQKNLLDDNLCQCHELYDMLRRNGSLERMVVHQVNAGTFSALRDLIMEQNQRTAPSQFKMPRVQRNRNYLRFLISNVAE